MSAFRELTAIHVPCGPVPDFNDLIEDPDRTDSTERWQT